MHRKKMGTFSFSGQPPEKENVPESRCVPPGQPGEPAARCYHRARSPGQRPAPCKGVTVTMEAFLVSTGVVALAEIGDKTQLLALVLAARFRKPVPIILGILVATLANHAMAGAVGAWLAALIGPDAMRWVLGLSFVAMAIWTLIPDKLDDDEGERKQPQLGVFGTTLVAFFLLEMGDKTQIATVALAAKYSSLASVVAGTTLGMMLANVPAVLLGEVAARKLPMRVVHGIAGAIFLVMGVLLLLGVGDLPR
jgi:putative Ca2+/H+ antiporter (TMEM165/GDT1 family)